MPPLKDLLGKPGEGFHFHVYGVAVMDVIATIIAGCFLGLLYHQHEPSAPLYGCMLLSTVALFVIGEGLHMIVGVETTFIKWLDRNLGP